jgi:hypothetical protein
MNPTSNPEEKRITVTFSTTKEIKDLIISEAKHDERSVSVFLNRLLRDALKQTATGSQQS